MFSHVLNVVLPNILPVSVAGIFRGQESALRLCSGAVRGISDYLQLWDQILSFSGDWVIMVINVFVYLFVYLFIPPLLITTIHPQQKTC